ncbi:NAD-dependent succinate-semialdehyde dehydrogenase [Sphingosinicella microcystinivorans]|uniref:NAD-dependent succinate-semialdehyde dehydrogenase n=1 Tax=Sphingosinicella microcystinivorans TaxID=335406 RepID=UPI0022F3BD5E|nr:NAD-dependent succinate-semialdehyde dehydrogenase [Sphingosinicella microcystinivorans]WBX86304.1 NAD-dependent succinate-semialdehyde dehydrogenase [Sphingosinicella microcystinivorans]
MALPVSAAASALIARGLALGGSASRTFPVFNPANGVHVADVADGTADDMRAAIAKAKSAFPAWSTRTAKERGAILRRWHGLVVENADALAEILTLEQGKPLAEARGEILFGANFIEWFAEEAKRVYGDIVPAHAPDKRCLVLKQPVGVVGAITPWNFPSGMITRKVAPALAAGCTIVVKPAEDTPLSALALAVLAADAGLPENVMTVVTAARAAEVAGVLTASPDVRKLSFTGSTRVGKLLMRACADTVKKLSLELGGNAPFIVFDDADLDAAVAGAMATKFRNAGQTCVSANRIYVQSGVMEAFARKYAEAVRALNVGDGFETGTQIGPLINAAAVEKVDGLVQDAIGKGAAAVLGGGRHERGGNFYAPTILTGVRPEMEIAHAEIFGPVAPLTPFETETEVVARANDTPYGLAAYFWSRDVGRVFRVAEALEYGMVGANEVLTSNEGAPFGGIKESGIGREGSRYGIEDFIEIKYLALGGIAAAA